MLAPEEEKFYQDFLAVVAQKWRPAKAAFYTLDPGGAVFRLKAQFGFTRGDRLAERLGRNEPLVNQIYEHREPTFINNVNQAGRLSDTMVQSTSTRMLVAPLYLDGRIMGLVDVRDKAGRISFTHDDSLEIADLLRRFAVELRRRNDAMDGSAILREGALERSSDTLAPPPTSPSPLEKTSGFAAIPASTSGIYRRVAPPVAAPEPVDTALPGVAARTMRLVEETLSRGGSQRLAASPGGGLSARETEFIQLYLPSCLNYDEVEVAAVSSFQPAGGTVTFSARRPIDADVLPALLENLEKIFAKTAVPFGFAREPALRPLDLPGDGRPVRRADIAAIQSSVLESSPEGVVLFSLLYRHGPNPDARETLRSAHVVLRNVLSGSRGETRFREAYRGLVNKLLEPGIMRRTALKTHSFNVGRMARKLAVQIGVAAMEVEQITVAAILHDVGLRELNYDIALREALAHGRGARAPQDAPPRGRVPRRGHPVAVPDRAPRQEPPRTLGRRRVSGRPPRRADSARLAHHPPVRGLRRDDGAHVLPGGALGLPGARHHRVEIGHAVRPRARARVQAHGREPLGLTERA